MAGVGELLRGFRIRALLTQEELAARTGLSERTIRRIEAGVLRPRAASMRLLMEGLGLGPAEQGLLAVASDSPVSVDPASGVPRQLPMDVDGFVGRAWELKKLDEMLSDRQARAAMISVVSGPAGVGKTALAVHWAHTAVDEFPDGQLYIDLAGFDPADPPLSTGRAVRGFLQALGLPQHRVPRDLDGQCALYRSALAGQRVLVLLDNVRDVEQVRPLLPGASSCRVIVTSRNTLTGLVALEGAQSVVLDLLSQDEARELLHTRLGPERAAAEPAALDGIIGSCARLPLALSIVAARASVRPARQLASFAAELVGHGLDPLSTADGDARADVRAVLSWSYHALGPQAARSYRMLGLHPGTAISAAAAASLVGLPERDTWRVLTELTQASLLIEQAYDRYSFHDLLRAYAGELADTIDTDDERHAALRRMLDHYLHTALAAVRQLDPYRTWVEPIDAAPGVVLGEGVDDAAATQWFTLAHPALLAMVQLAASAGFDTHAAQLAWVMADHLDPRGPDRHGLLPDYHTVYTQGLAAAKRLGDVAAQSRLIRALGNASARLGRYRDAHEHLRRAVDLSNEVGDHREEAAVHHYVAWLYGREGKYHEALRHAQLSLESLQPEGEPARVARARNGVGWYQALLGQLDRALEHCRAALPLLQETGDRYGEASTWHSLGFIHHQLGDYGHAAACYRRSSELARLTGHRHLEAEAIDGLGNAHAATGEEGLARDAWLAALDILDDLDQLGADGLRSKLRQHQY